MSTYDPSTYQGLTFHEAIGDFRQGSCTPMDYLEHCLETISQQESRIKAWVVLNEGGAREQAAASTARWREGAPLSPIDGMPIGIKDLLETEDMPTGQGCRALEGTQTGRDNSAVWALRRAGAVILGKTVTAELGGQEPGPTRNPFDSRRTPGGSSSGSAAAVASGMIPAAIGSQVLGSIVRPASFCGNWALKPTQGAIHRGERMATSMSTHGVHANSLADVWITTRQIAQRTGGDPGAQPVSGPDTLPAAQRPATLALLHTEGWDRADHRAREALTEVADQLADRGVTLMTVEESSALARLEEALQGVLEVAALITSWESQWGIRALARRSPEGISPRSHKSLAAAEALGLHGYLQLIAQREQVRQAYCVAASEVSAFLTLSAPGAAPISSRGNSPEHERWPTGDPVFSAPSSLIGGPALTMPLASVDGLPLGIQLMGLHGQDAILTGYARWCAEHLEAVTR